MVKTNSRRTQWALYSQWSHGTKSTMLEIKVRTGTSKTKKIQVWLDEVALFWISQCSHALQHGGSCDCLAAKGPFNKTFARVVHELGSLFDMRRKKRESMKSSKAGLIIIVKDFRNNL